jgi:hypothetical protein
MQFFAALGFELHPRFTGEKAACMILSEDAYVMLLVEPFFRTFTTREVCDTTSHTEALLALCCASRAEAGKTSAPHAARFPVTRYVGAYALLCCSPASATAPASDGQRAVSTYR